MIYHFAYLLGATKKPKTKVRTVKRQSGHTRVTEKDGVIISVESIVNL